MTTAVERPKCSDDETDEAPEEQPLSGEAWAPLEAEEEVGEELLLLLAGPN